MSDSNSINPYEISVEVNGKTYNGTYKVKKGVITVSSALSHSSTHLGGTPPEALAKILLREMAESGKLDIW